MKKILYICIVQELSDLKIPYFYIFSDLEAVLTVVEYRRYQWDWCGPGLSDAGYLQLTICTNVQNSQCNLLAAAWSWHSFSYKNIPEKMINSVESIRYNTGWSSQHKSD